VEWDGREEEGLAEARTQQTELQQTHPCVCATVTQLEEHAEAMPEEHLSRNRSRGMT
jgi:hypothetical protein